MQTNILTHIISSNMRPILPFYIRNKHHKTSGFLMFSMGIERKHWPKMGQASFWKSIFNKKCQLTRT